VTIRAVLGMYLPDYATVTSIENTSGGWGNSLLPE